jgi:hypothetical protein
MPTRKLCPPRRSAPMHFSSSSFRWARSMPSGARSQAFNSWWMKPLPRCGSDCRIISPHAHSTKWKSGSSSKDSIMGWFIPPWNILMLQLEVHSLLLVSRKPMHWLKRWLLVRAGLMGALRPAPARFTSLKRCVCSPPRLIFSWRNLKIRGFITSKWLTIVWLVKSAKKRAIWVSMARRSIMSSTLLGTPTMVFVQIKASIQDGISLTSPSTTASKAVMSRFSTGMSHLSEILSEIGWKSTKILARGFMPLISFWRTWALIWTIS